MATVTLQDVSSTGVEEMLCNKLWQFRLGLEAQADQPVAALEVPVALLLSDLCVFAGLSEEQHARVLGEEGLAYVNEILAMRWTLKASGPPTAARR